MYITNEEQIASAESFVGKIPESIVKGDYQRWILEVKKTLRITSEQLDKFVSLSHALPKELQNFPQSFRSLVKNSSSTAKQEAKEGTVQKAQLASVTDKSISKVPDVDKVREGAKLNPEKQVAKPAVKPIASPVVPIRGGKK